LRSIFCRHHSRSLLSYCWRTTQIRQLCTISMLSFL